MLYKPCSGVVLSLYLLWYFCQQNQHFRLSVRFDAVSYGSTWFKFLHNFAYSTLRRTIISTIICSLRTKCTQYRVNIFVVTRSAVAEPSPHYKVANITLNVCYPGWHFCFTQVTKTGLPNAARSIYIIQPSAEAWYHRFKYYLLY